VTEKKFARTAWLVSSAAFIYRLYRLEPRASRSKGASKKLWYA